MRVLLNPKKELWSEARKDKKGIYEIKDQSAPNRFYPHVHHMSKQKTIINYHFIMREKANHK